MQIRTYTSEEQCSSFSLHTEGYTLYIALKQAVCVQLTLSEVCFTVWLFSQRTNNYTHPRGHLIHVHAPPTYTGNALHYLPFSQKCDHRYDEFHEPLF